ncbi:MAG: hypothetical protein ACO1TE_29100 [Prosthecobacter sp.]
MTLLLDVTFAGMSLASAVTMAGTWAADFAPAGEQAVEPLEALRADWAEPVARGNRLETLTLTLTPPPAADVHEAFVELAYYFSRLPSEGALRIRSGGKVVRYPTAALASHRPRPRRGLSNQYTVTWLVGKPDDLALAVLDEDGEVLLDEAGQELEY